MLPPQPQSTAEIFFCEYFYTPIKSPDNLSNLNLDLRAKEQKTEHYGLGNTDILKNNKTTWNKVLLNFF